MTFEPRTREKLATTRGTIVELLKPRDDQNAACIKQVELALEDVEDHFGFLSGTYVTDSKMRARLRRLADAIRRVAAPWNDMNDVRIKGAGIFPFDAPVKVLEGMDDFLAFGRLCGKVAAAAEKEKRTKPDIDAAMKGKAAEHAYQLVKQYGWKPSSKKDSNYCRIAKLLHGGGDDLTKQCKTCAEEHSEVR